MLYLGATIPTRAMQAVRQFSVAQDIVLLRVDLNHRPLGYDPSALPTELPSMLLYLIQENI